MHPLALSGSHKLIAGIILGIILGFILVRSKGSDRKSFSDLIGFRDPLLINIFLVTVAVGAPLIYLTNMAGLTETNIRPVYFWGAILGGFISGIGIVNCKQIPATALANLGEGKLYSLWTIAGMLLAMAVAKLMSGFLSNTIYSWNAPFTFHQKIDDYFPTGIVVIWICLLSTLMTVFLYFVMSRGKKSED
jgi:energy-converting hydrogenase Eha subunit A